MHAIRTILLLLVWLASQCALAHKPSDSYLKLAGGAEHLQVQWDIAIKDLEYLIGLDADGNGQITWGELKSQRRAIVAHAQSRLRLDAEGLERTLHFDQLMATLHSDGGYAVLIFQTDCPGDAAQVTLHYNLLFDADPTHRGLVLYANGSTTSTYVLSADAPSVTLHAADANLLASFVAFVREGVWHIWIGFDHILFLTLLLLPAVLERREHGWGPVKSFRPTYAAVLTVVTMFTVAHSITLWLAVMQYVTLPSQWVETSIALSIVITAANNVFPVLPLSNWAIAFVFGLVHGFGFANVLLDLGLNDAALATSLLGFNVGVELGQLAIVLALLPLLYAMRHTLFYRWMVFRTGSVAVGIIGALWTVERVFNLQILGV